MRMQCLKPFLTVKGCDIAVKYKIAIGSRDGKAVTEHFGGCSKFLIVSVDDESTTYKFTGFLDVESPCSEGTHSDDKLDAAAKALDDCRIVLIAKIGPAAQYALERRGIDVLEYHGLIEDALKKIIKYYR